MAFLPLADTNRATRLAPVVFTATIFLSASLLFFVQPLFAKIVLPVIGGSPSVWTTAMLFFQTVLLGGYLYAHFSTRYLTPRTQIMAHMLIWAAALTFLPPALPEGWVLDPTTPIAWQTLGLFALGVGVPFALLSSNAPFIQAWYARSGGPSSDDPYFLYGASNLGSLIALMAFPLLAEPFFGAGQISWGFAFGFGLLGFGLLASGLFAMGRGAAAQVTARQDTARPGGATMAYWMVLAFVPSSLMLAVTSKITTDVGAMPLVWTIPLSLFLLSFVLAFRDRTPFQGLWFTQASQLMGVAGLCLFAGVAGDHLSSIAMAFLVLVFFTLATWMHRSLYEARPDAAQLTTFYVVMSIGGALGGLFNSILAPALFTDLIEGTVTMSIALLLLFQTVLKLDGAGFAKGAILGAVTGAAALATALWLKADPITLLAIMGVSTILIATLRPGLPVFAVAASLAVAMPAWLAAPDNRLFADRSFFGLHQVFDDKGVRLYSNGTTLHGAQRLTDMADARPVPTTYYHPKGPMGQVMQSDLGLSARRVGIVGLGVGSLACYAQPGQDWHFYEIDAMVDQVARDDSLFTFLSQCTPNAPTHLGDARIVLEGQDNLGFDLLVIDAYSSDAVPVHLTTREAMQLYLNRLNPTGVLLFHISNRYYDIGLPLARSAEALGVRAWRQNQDRLVSDDPGFRLSDVVLIAGATADVSGLLASGNWSELISDGGPVWTDDQANPLSILKPGAVWQ